jgi:hypothetical protein
MSIFYKLFLKHPHKENMSYFGHLYRAISLSVRLSVASIYLLVHGFIPSCFEYNGSNMIKQIYEEVNKREL